MEKHWYQEILAASPPLTPSLMPALVTVGSMCVKQHSAMELSQRTEHNLELWVRVMSGINFTHQGPYKLLINLVVTIRGFGN